MIVRVVDEKGDAVSGVTLHITWEGGSKTITTTSNIKGELVRSFYQETVITVTVEDPNGYEITPNTVQYTAPEF